MEPNSSPKQACTDIPHDPSIIIVNAISLSPSHLTATDSDQKRLPLSHSRPSAASLSSNADTSSNKSLSKLKRWAKIDRFKANISKLYQHNQMPSYHEEFPENAELSMLLPSSEHEAVLSPLEVRIEMAVQDESDDFWREVVRKSSEQNLTRTDAIIDQYTEQYVSAAGSANSALTKLLSSCFNEETINLFAKSLLAKGASPFACDEERNTPLHLTAAKGLMVVARKLVDSLAVLHAKNREGDTPFELAVNHKQDVMAAYLAGLMPDYEVRRLFTASGDDPSRVSFHYLLDNAAEFRETIHAVLDSMKVYDQQTADTYHVYYGVLEADSRGFQPRQAHFNRQERSCLHIIARSGYEEIVYHDTVRLLLRMKWKKFGRMRFLLQFLTYLLHILAMSVAFILAAREANPKHYFSPAVTASNTIRLLCEIVYYVFLLWNLATEIFQMFRHRLRYLLDWYNYLDMGAIVCSLLIIPLRFSQNPQAENAQWFFAAIAYLLNVMRGYKFAVVLRTTGAYVEIIGSILRYDIVPFSIVFIMFLFGFSGATYLALKFEGVVDASRASSLLCPLPNLTNGSENIRCEDQTYLVSEWWFVFFNGLRVMIESGPVFENYYRPCSTCGFGWFSLILHATFLFFVIVVFLNLIIAQMSDTYQNVWSDAQRKLYKNRAWILARIEHNSLLTICLRNLRDQHYVPLETIKNPKNILDKWEAPPLNSLGKNVEKLQEAAEQQDHKLEEIKAMLSDHERLLIQVLRNQALQADTEIEVPRVKPRSHILNQVSQANKVSEGITQIRSFLQTRDK